MLRAIVFDFDGVIANSEPLHFAAFRDVLAEDGMELTRQHYYESYLGYDDVHFFQTIAADRGKTWDAAAVASLVRRKAIHFEQLERRGSTLFPGAASAIREAAKAMPIAIASGARGDEIRRVLDRENLMSCFHAVVSAEDTSASKPAPDPYLRALALLASAFGGTLDARECVAIEDSRRGIDSARAAGMWTVGVAQTYPPDELGAADLVIASMADLDLRALGSLCQ